ncbi:hypothetical protein GCM10010840_21680 [Deinococcus aerolatus]|uniref:Uncharacterized protein n=1 Tax=Deinococcus aerolatus TaxID=522487 RepID=A0ABQ2GAY1_9DEIO|nr:hypothetical protein [Deinococcus aerolatus]GGL83580.1 hypothetical protein GCM10010840_21680 [Deinococcus aerolatus]
MFQQHLEALAVQRGLVEELEGRLKVELARLSDLAARTVAAHLGQRSGGSTDRETLDAQARAIRHDLEAFTKLAAPDEGAARRCCAGQDMRTWEVRRAGWARRSRLDGQGTTGRPDTSEL